MDRLDKISFLAIVILIISSFVVAAGHKSEEGPALQKKQKKTAANYTVAKSEIDAEVKMVRNILESNNLEKAESLVKELLRKYPFEGEPHMLMADIHVRKQDILMAMPEYMEAVDINPDYLDKKTPLFQGKKIKKTVREALAEVERKLQTDPADEDMRETRKTIYYLERRIAGSCG